VTYFVQTGAFAKESEADNQRANLALMGVDATVLSPEAGDKSLYRVRVGPIVSVDEVRTLVATLKNNGISTNIIKVSSVKPKDATSR
jgi:cell division protein FtsN